MLPFEETVQQPFSFGHQSIAPEFGNFKSVLKDYLFGTPDNETGVFNVTGFDSQGRPIKQRIGDGYK